MKNIKTNYKVKLMYDGSLYYGWAKQKGYMTIQEKIEETLSLIFDQKITINGSGRTDKYVHAIDQCFNFKVINNKIPSLSIMKIFNQKINSGIKITSIKKVDDKFNARFSIISKTYEYKINIDKYNLFQRNYIYQYCNPINLTKIKNILKMFVGTKNFLSFSTSELDDTIRTINNISITKKENIISIKINGNGFLRNMVRMIVGVLLDYNEQKIDIDRINYLFDNPKKGLAIRKAPGCGLYLLKTIY